MAKKGRRRLYPMPVEALFDAPGWITAPAAARGMLMSLFEHFWRTDCAPLPIADDQLFAIARAHRPTWRHHRASILAVFAEIRPDLEAYKRQRDAKATSINFAAKRAGESSSARHAAQRLAKAFPAPSTLASAPLAPLAPITRPEPLTGNSAELERSRPRRPAPAGALADRA